ncbi:hypothetical protein OROHE_000622 [Orobanche hederae]
MISLLLLLWRPKISIHNIFTIHDSEDDSKRRDFYHGRRTFLALNDDYVFATDYVDDTKI